MEVLPYRDSPFTMCQIITLSILKSHNVIGQLYPKKVGRTSKIQKTNDAAWKCVFLFYLLITITQNQIFCCYSYFSGCIKKSTEFSHLFYSQFFFFCLFVCFLISRVRRWPNYDVGTKLLSLKRTTPLPLWVSFPFLFILI